MKIGRVVYLNKAKGHRGTHVDVQQSDDRRTGLLKVNE